MLRKVIEGKPQKEENEKKEEDGESEEMSDM